MNENRYGGPPGLNRRTFLKGTVASAFAGTGLSAGTGLVAGAASGTLVVEQGGNSYEVQPLSYESQTVEEFYSFSNYRSHTSTGIERDDVSALFFWRGPDGLSLVVLHDHPNSPDGGEATFSFDGLPADGTWVVRDDDPGNDTYGRSTVDWQWGSNRTDGGGFRGGLADGFEIDLDPDFISGIDRWQLLSPGSVQRRAFDLHNRYSSSDRTRGWEEVELDLSAFAGQEVTIRLQADGRWTYNREDTVSWIKADYVRIDGVLDEEFDTLDGWACTNQPRGDGYDDTPTKGFCRAQDGYAYVQEETNRTRFLSRTVELPADGDLVLRARVKGHISASWSHARLAVEGNAGATDPERTELDMGKPVTIRFEGTDDRPALIDEKDALIDDIRGAAQPFFSTARASELDATAERLLSEIDAQYESADSTERERYVEALRRMVDAETLTLSATDKPVDVTRRTGSAIVSAATIGLTEGLGRTAIGAFNFGAKAVRVGVSIVRRFGRRLLSFLLRRGIIDGRTARRISRTLDEYADDLDRIVENNEDEVSSAADYIFEESGLEGALGDALAPNLIDTFEDIRRETDEIVQEAVYQRYYLAADSPDDFDLPSFDQLSDAFDDLPIPHVPLPIVDLPDPSDLDLPEPPGVSKVDDAVAILESVDDVVGPLGIDPSIGERMEDLEAAIDSGSLEPADGDLRELILDVIETVMGGATDVAEFVLDVLDGIIELLLDAEMVTIGLIVLAVAVAVATGGSAGPVLGVLGALLTKIALSIAVLYAGEAAVGTTYLQAMDKLHFGGTAGIVRHVSFDGGAR